MICQDARDIYDNECEYRVVGKSFLNIGSKGLERMGKQLLAIVKKHQKNKIIKI
jgi:hypothetical protein